MRPHLGEYDSIISKTKQCLMFWYYFIVLLYKFNQEIFKWFAEQADFLCFESCVHTKMGHHLHALYPHRAH